MTFTAAQIYKGSRFLLGEYAKQAGIEIDEFTLHKEALGSVMMCFGEIPKGFKATMRDDKPASVE